MIFGRRSTFFLAYKSMQQHPSILKTEKLLPLANISSKLTRNLEERDRARASNGAIKIN